MATTDVKEVNTGSMSWIETTHGQFCHSWGTSSIQHVFNDMEKYKESTQEQDQEDTRVVGVIAATAATIGAISSIIGFVKGKKVESEFEIEFINNSSFTIAPEHSLSSDFGFQQVTRPLFPRESGSIKAKKSSSFDDGNHFSLRLSIGSNKLDVMDCSLVIKNISGHWRISSLSIDDAPYVDTTPDNSPDTYTRQYIAFQDYSGTRAQFSIQTHLVYHVSGKLTLTFMDLV